MKPGSRMLSMQRLAREVIMRRNRDAAMVLGDALMEQGVTGGFPTGRVQPVVIHVSELVASPDRLHPSVLTRSEVEVLSRRRRMPIRITMPGREVLYNVTQYASSPTKEQWGHIWSQWITTRRDMYRALVKTNLLPRSVRFGEIEFKPRIAGNADLPYFSEDIMISTNLYLVRVPPRRKRPVRVFLMHVVRLDSDNPHTRIVYFDRDPVQQTLFARSPQRDLQRRRATMKGVHRRRKRKGIDRRWLLALAALPFIPP